MHTFDLPPEYTYLQARLIRRHAWVDDALLSLAEAVNDAPMPHSAPPIMVTQMPIDEDAPCVEENEFLFRCVEFLAEAMSLAVAVSRWHHTKEVSPGMYGAAVRFPDGPPLASSSNSGAGMNFVTPRGKTGVIGASVVYPEAANEGEYFLDEQLPYVLNPRALHPSVSDIKVISPFTLEEYSVIELIEECEAVHMGNCAASEQERLSAMPNPYAVAREHGHDLAACLAEYESWVCNEAPGKPPGKPHG